MGPTKEELDYMRAKLIIDLTTMKGYYTEKKRKNDEKINQILVDIKKLKSSSRFKKLSKQGSEIDMQKFKSSKEYIALEKEYKMKSYFSKYFDKILAERIEEPLKTLELGSTFKDISAMNKRIYKYKSRMGFAIDEFKDIEEDFENSSEKAIRPGYGDGKRSESEESLKSALKNVLDSNSDNEIDDRLNNVLENTLSIDDLLADNDGSDPENS
jgi:hypothetical protein